MRHKFLMWSIPLLLITLYALSLDRPIMPRISLPEVKLNPQIQEAPVMMLFDAAY